jgi:hypothetical protein
VAISSQTFIVRVWLEAGVPGVWRASATDASTQERRFFPSPESLVDFLKHSPGQPADESGPQPPQPLGPE